MASSPIDRWSRILSVTAAVLIVLSQVTRLGLAWLLGPGWASTPAYTVAYVLALLGMGFLLLALAAIYARVSRDLGRVGLIGYPTAFLGTVLVAGDWWFEAFAMPVIATQAPQLLDLPPGGALLVGAIASIGLYTVGWTLLGVAALHAPMVPRPAAVLLLIGALAGPLALSAPYQIPLAVAVGWIGYSLDREPLASPASSRASEPVLPSSPVHP